MTIFNLMMSYDKYLYDDAMMTNKVKVFSGTTADGGGVFLLLPFLWTVAQLISHLLLLFIVGGGRSQVAGEEC